ncbi:glutamate receptor ionotropic, kainate 2-like [Uloborus diversus]|uniref:glutamate receptor ionotropic, kainate 2-like n=1 Tax=Uloborus diversus TaxID=327109 RepID=UPI0024091333|nr:glutamate receptor ionotropic, kainate 2-like [Uloborus diversus]
MPCDAFRVLLSVFIIVRVQGLPAVVPLGGLFDLDDSLEQKTVFLAAVDRVNADANLLPRSKLVAYVEEHPPDNSFEASKKACRLLSYGVAGLFGPESSCAASHVRSVCDALEVPHIECRWDPGYQRDDPGLSVNVYPQPSLLSRAYLDVVRKWGWTKFNILYEENEGIVRLQDFLKEASERDWDIRIHQFREGMPFRELFRHIRATASKDPEICILLDVSRRNIQTALKQAQQVEMMTVRNKYIITSLDLHTAYLEDFQFSRANVTGFGLLRTESEEYRTLLQEVQAETLGAVTAISTSAALLHDAVLLFSRALQDLDNGKDVGKFPPLSCDEAIPTATKGTDGTSLVNYMKSNKIQGLTGLVHFDGQGFRSSFSLDLLQLTKDGLKKIGTVFPGRDINITEELGSMNDDGTGYLFEHKKFIITTILNKPFAMLRNSPRPLSGNERYEGFGVDLIEELSKRLHFDYEIREVADNKYGVEIDKERGLWNGMVGEVLRGEADMAVADVTISSTREKVLDFTLPFMSTGISILLKKPTTKVKSLFSFLSPFSGEVWIYVMAAFLGVSSVLFVCGRLSPYEWGNSTPCRRSDEEGWEENEFSILNSMWFTISALMQQGCEITPRSSSTRTVAGLWYFFTLIMISSYTANLAAFLTVEKVVYPIESAEDLAKQTKVKYGCLASGSTRTFFESSAIPTYHYMWEQMRQNPEVLMESNERGKERVYAGNYAFLMESASIQFITERECNLTQIGGLLDHKGYGIAIKKGNASLTSWLSSGILKLQEEGILHDLKERWWKQKRGGGRCTRESTSGGTVRELGLGNVGGVFVVLLAGVSMAVVVAGLEFLWKYRKVATHSQEDIGKLMAKEIKFALTCSNSTKEAPKFKKKKLDNNSLSTMSDLHDIRYAFKDNASRH